jgi:1-phosphofructokinase
MWYELAVVAGIEAGVAVFCGSVDDEAEEVVPASMYERLSTGLARNGCRVLVDLTGARLAATLAGLAPSVVKISHEELVSGGRARSDSLDDLAKAAREILDHGVELVVVSRAAEPTFALYDGGQVLLSPPSFEPVDTRGGGDSMTAGLAAAFAQDKDRETALRLGAAAGAVDVTRHGLGSGSGEAVRRLAERVEIAPVG